MEKVYRKSLVVALVMILATGSVVNAAVGVISCFPKACCCTMQTHGNMEHIEQMAMPENCTPKKPAPCCRVEPSTPKADLAIFSPPNIIPHRMASVYMLADDMAEAPQQTDSKAFNPTMDTGPLKIISVPIYIQTMSIIC